MRADHRAKTPISGRGHGRSRGEGYAAGDGAGVRSEHKHLRAAGSGGDADRGAAPDLHPETASRDAVPDQR
jgi:hypothetical protein